MYDFMYRRYSPVQGRWISTDPAGLGAVDPTNPQTWNRYGYVAEQPLNATDPDGQMMVLVQPCGLDAGYAASCDGGGENGALLWAINVFGGIWGSISGGGVGAGTSAKGSQSPGTKSPGIRGSYPNGETLGIPNGFPWRPGSIWSVFLPIGTQCEFGPCVTIGMGLEDAYGRAIPTSVWAIELTARLRSLSGFIRAAGRDVCNYYDTLCKDGDNYGCKAAICCRSFGSSPKVNSVRQCLVNEDYVLCSNRPVDQRAGCRVSSHYYCYVGNDFYPNLFSVPTSCLEIILGK